jgi:hypothetical protein
LFLLVLLPKKRAKSEGTASLSAVIKHERQQVAFAIVELEDVRDGLAAAVSSGPMHGDQLSAAVTGISDALARLEDVRTAAAGLAVADAAGYLSVSQPTVRDWLRRGLLTAVPNAKPVLVERSSAREVHAMLQELRDRGQDGNWLRAFVDYLHDRGERKRPAIVKGLQQMERGDLEPA